MRKMKLLFAAFSAAFSFPAYLAAQCPAPQPVAGTYSDANGQSTYVVSMPAAGCYNGDVILFAHGYVATGSAPNAWESQLALPDGTTLPSLVNSLGFGFAASSFSKQGLAVVEGIQDTLALEKVITNTLQIPVHKFFITGASEGGLITAKSVEENLGYAGGLAVCGPIGSFRDQLNYFGNVRVLFDYFFPGVLPGDAINIPPQLVSGWTSTYEPLVVKAVQSNPIATLQLLATAQIPIGLSFSNAASSITQVLWYNVFATADAITELHGIPFDNATVVYHGSFNDARLNAQVQRVSASPIAIANLHAYETTGNLPDPLVTLHTIFDPVIPFWQETLYHSKAKAHEQKLVQIPVLSYGHCNVTGPQAEAALAALLLKTGL
jgi:hypothetical protein